MNDPLTLNKENKNPKYIDLFPAVLIAVAAGLISQYLSYFYDYGYAYRDAIFRMEAARRFFDNLNPGIISQIGTVWLPVPNLILMPFVCIDYLWTTGLAAAIVNFPAFVLSAVFIFLSLRRLTNNAAATWFGFIIYVFNYNILYFQTTAMTEQLYLTFLIGAFYSLLVWSETGSVKSLLAASFFTMLSTGTRYDAWPVALAAVAIVFIVSIPQKKYFRNSIIFASLPAALIIWWFVHNWYFYGDALEFSRGKFSTLHQLKYYEDAGRLLTKHNFFLSFKVYIFSVLLYSGNLYTIMSFAGILYYILRNKLNLKSFIPYILWVAFPTTLLLLYMGQLIIEHPFSDPAGYFNSRYGLYLFPAIAIFAGYSVLLLGKSKIKKYLFVLLWIGFAVQQAVFLVNFPYSIPSLAESKYSYSKASDDLSAYLKENYKGGRILYDNQIFALNPNTGINLKDRITFHTFDLGEKAMKKPSEYVEWVLIYTDAPNDKIYDAVKYNNDFLGNYEKTFTENGIEVYRKK
ncbi:MAG: hypothetical protein PHN88_13480 [Ignavibacteria bacterium]|nr:hypothetical protein [Ignavibacteria bacterium]